jgi:hypothetical protein
VGERELFVCILHSTGPDNYFTVHHCSLGENELDEIYYNTPYDGAKWMSLFKEKKDYYN